jgi:hypothetical protein
MRAILAIIMLAGLSLGALAQDPPKAPEAPATPAEASIHGYGDTEKTCLEWNDGCRTCRRQEGGKPACSNIGIACQPTAITCTRRVDPPK